MSAMQSIQRIVAFSETFAELGKANNKMVVAWNESVSGKNAQNICSALWNFLITIVKDKKEITSLNKNWRMLTFFKFCSKQKVYCC